MAAASRARKHLAILHLMLNPFNPLDWLRSAQDWFAKSEKSSGFRPYLIYFLLCIGIALGLLTLFPANSMVQTFALGLIGVPAIAFIVLFAWKAERDPDFCRSESHVQKIKRYELEVMGNETKQIEGRILEEATQLPSSVEPRALPGPGEEGRA
jgi:hypothetical protein